MRTNKKTEKTLINVYDFIKKYIEASGYPPTVREIMTEVNVTSTSTVKYYLDKLEEKGLVKRTGNKNRALEIIKKESFANSSAPLKTNILSEHNKSQSNMRLTEIPVIGDVAAGTPIMAVENYEEIYEFSENIFNKSGELFILTVKGESMINAGIFNRDKIVVRKQNFANNSDIVVAMINGSATVKRFYKEANRVRLQPENDFMQPIYCVDVDILGKVIGLIRNY